MARRASLFQQLLAQDAHLGHLGHRIVLSANSGDIPQLPLMSVPKKSSSKSSMRGLCRDIRGQMLEKKPLHACTIACTTLDLYPKHWFARCFCRSAPSARSFDRPDRPRSLPLVHLSLSVRQSCKGCWQRFHQIRGIKASLQHPWVRVQEPRGPWHLEGSRTWESLNLVSFLWSAN